MSKDKKDPQYPAMSKAQEGNEKGVLFPTPEDRKKACEAYIEHIATGFSKKSFELCSPETIDKYIKNFPEDFNVHRIEAAFRVGRKVWEQRGHDLVLGKIDGNSPTWFRIMQNQYDFRDRLDITTEDEKITAPPVDMAKLKTEDLKILADILTKAKVDDESESDV